MTCVKMYMGRGIKRGNKSKMQPKIYDIHCHLVHNVDDGAHDIDMSMEMLRNAYNQGVRHIVCTSHSWCDVKKYNRNINALKERVKKENININLYAGCEIRCSCNYIDDIIDELNKGKLKTINDTDYVLVEFSPNEKKEEIVYCVNALLNEGYNPVIAHVERYVNLRENIGLICFLNDIGVLFQVNAYSISGEQKKEVKDAARNLIQNKLVSFIGSDAHGTYHRAYAVQKGINYIYKNCSRDYANSICYKNAERMFNGN